MKRGILTLSLLSFVLLSGCNNPSPSNNGYQFFEDDGSSGQVGYEIFTGSYCDSNNDGTGDFLGIKSKLPYLKALGYKRIWLTPIGPSQSYHKYDVDDYFAVDSAFGTLEDFDLLVTECHALGLEIIIDLVLNHSSNHNQLFLDSEKDYRDNNTSETSKKDYYVWSKTSQDGFSYSSTANAFYEANFSNTMPEFDLSNPKVVEMIHEICDFWLIDHNIDGFRLDAVIYYFFKEQSKNVPFLTELNNYIKEKKPSAYVIGEAWETSQSIINNYSASGMNFFNFPTAEMNNYGPGKVVNSPAGVTNFAESIVKAQKGIASSSNGKGSRLCSFLGNHDTTRVGGYYSGDVLKQKMLASLSLLTPGTPWTYYGEEIGMKGVKKDGDYLQRTGMLWGKNETRANYPYGVVDSSFQVSVGALDGLEDPDSLINHYKMVLSTRNHFNSLFTDGTFVDLALEKPFAGFKITKDEKTCYLIHNVSKTAATATLAGSYTILSDIKADGVSSSVRDGKVSLGAFSSVLLG